VGGKGERNAFIIFGAYSWWGVGKVQLCAYANHEFKIIPTPAQLSAYAYHKPKN